MVKLPTYRTKSARGRTGAIPDIIGLLEPRLLMTAYYANASAVTNGSGTSASPWNTLASISAFAGFHSGDVVNLSGTFNNQVLSLGSSATGITITSSATSPAKIVESSTYSFVSAITVLTAGVTISNLQLTGPGITADNNSYFGIFFDNTGSSVFTGATVNNVNESGFVFAGLQISGTTAGFANASVTNSNFSSNQVSGIVVGGSTSQYSNSNLLISNCTASDNAGAAIYWNAHNTSNQNSDNGGIFISSVNGAVVEHCQTIGNCYDSSGAVGTWAADCNAVNFEYDQSGDNRTTLPGSDGDGFDFDHGVSDSVMQYDYSHGNDAAGYLICAYSGLVNDTGDTVRYCISDDDCLDGGPAISIYGFSMNLIPHSVLGCNIYDNTVLVGAPNASAAAVTGLTPVAAGYCTVNFLNNIFYSTNGDPLVNCSFFTPSVSSITFEGNDYFSTGGVGSFEAVWGTTTYASLSAWSLATGEESLGSGVVGSNLDPMLANQSVSDLPIGSISNLELSLNSPLRGAGLNLSSYPFNSAAQYTSYAPYNLAGTAWGGLGAQDYFGDPLSTAGSHDVGADQASALLLAGGSLSLKADATAPDTLDVNSASYSLAGIDSVVITGSTAANTITCDFANGPLKNNTGPLSQFGVTFIAGSASNTLTTLDSGAGASGTMPVFFVPGSSAMNSLNAAAGVITVPAGVQSGINDATFSSIKISAGAKVQIASPTSVHSNRTLLVVTGSLSLAGTPNAWTGTLDLGANDLDMKNGNLATLNNQISQGSHEDWLGPGGIISSAAAADTTHLTALGVIQNSINGSPSGSTLYTTFDSTSVLNTDVLVKYTFVGDANLDGVVDGTDYSLIDNGEISKLTGWYDGDFNYDGQINADDYTLIDNAFNMQSTSLAARIAAAVRTPTDGSPCPPRLPRLP